MKRLRSAFRRANRSDCPSHHDDIDRLVHHYVARQPVERSAAERWSRLARRIAEHQSLQALIAQMTTPGAEVRRTALLLRPWFATAIPIA